MKNKLEKRLICHRLIRPLSGTPLAPTGALQGHGETQRGPEKHNTTVYFHISADSAENLPPTAGFISSIVARSP